MAADDMARALMALDDENVRRRVAAGELDGIDGGLSGDERALLVLAAGGDAEVVGHFRPIWNPPGMPTPDDPYNAAVEYTRPQIADPALGAAFTDWAATRPAWSTS